MQIKITSYSGFVHFYPFWGKLPQAFSSCPSSQTILAQDVTTPKMPSGTCLRPSHGAGRWTDKSNRQPKLGGCFPLKIFPSQGDCPALLITVTKNLLLSMSSSLSETNNPKWVPLRTIVVQSLSQVWLLATPWTAACQASLSFTVSWSLFKSCPLSWWFYLTIPSSVAPFSFWLQSFPASGSFPISRLFASGGQSIGVSASILPMNIQGCFPLRLTSL